MFIGHCQTSFHFWRVVRRVSCKRRPHLSQVVPVPISTEMTVESLGEFTFFIIIIFTMVDESTSVPHRSQTSTIGQSPSHSSISLHRASVFALSGPLTNFFSLACLSPIHTLFILIKNTKSFVIS